MISPGIFGTYAQLAALVARRLRAAAAALCPCGDHQ